MVYFCVEEETKKHNLHYPHHEKINEKKYVVIKEEKKWNW